MALLTTPGSRKPATGPREALQRAMVAAMANQVVAFSIRWQVPLLSFRALATWPML